MKRPNFRTQAFSLMELLAVVTLATIMLTLAGTAFTNFGRSTALATGGNQISALLDLARQNSITKGAMTAVAVSTDPSDEEKYREFILLEANTRNDGAALTASDWRPISKWEMLPKGITADKGCTFTDSSTTALVPSFPSVLPNRRGVAVSSFRYVIFLPDGRLQGEAPPGIQLVEGWWPEGANSPTYTRPGSGGEPANYYRISLLSKTGRQKIDRP